MSQILRFEQLPELRDGAFGMQVNQYINMLVRDCNDRPSLQKARTLTNTLEIGRNAAMREVSNRVFDALGEVEGMQDTPILSASLS